MGHSFFENLNKNTYQFCDNVLNKEDGYEAIKSFINANHNHEIILKII